jgi:hypothetical protein
MARYWRGAAPWREPYLELLPPPGWLRCVRYAGRAGLLLWLRQVMLESVQAMTDRGTARPGVGGAAKAQRERDSHDFRSEHAHRQGFFHAQNVLLKEIRPHHCQQARYELGGEQIDPEARFQDGRRFL